MVSDVPGWYPSVNSKRLLLEEYRAALHARSFINRSWDALDECLSFRYTLQGTVEHGREATGGDDPSGARANHGDRVIADALAWMLARKYAQSARPDDPDEVVPGSLAWRRNLVEDRKRLEEAWA